MNFSKKESKFFMRFAITSACNFKCEYCNPLGVREKNNGLSDEEILQIIKAGYQAGINKVHWTGGEPTLKNMELLISETKKIGYLDQVLTTNGSKGGEYVKKMVDQGLSRLIVSLDTLKPERFKKITKVDCIDSVLDTIEESVKLLEQPTKVNVVYTKETVDEIPYLIDLAKRINSNDNKGELIIKFLEVTKMNPAFFSKEGEETFSKIHDGKDLMMSELSKYGTLVDVTKKVVGNNPNTNYFRIPELGIVVGMINIPSNNYRCGGSGCAKIRLNSYGKVAVCINQKPIDIRGKSLSFQTKVLKDLQVYRGMLDYFYPDRKHQQSVENAGYWRFGDLNSGK